MVVLWCFGGLVLVVVVALVVEGGDFVVAQVCGVNAAWCKICLKNGG